MDHSTLLPAFKLPHFLRIPKELALRSRLRFISDFHQITISRCHHTNKSPVLMAKNCDICSENQRGKLSQFLICSARSFLGACWPNQVNGGCFVACTSRVKLSFETDFGDGEREWESELLSPFSLQPTSKSKKVECFTKYPAFTRFCKHGEVLGREEKMTGRV